MSLDMNKKPREIVFDILKKWQKEKK